ncbi:ABC transporter permease [[Pseudomonas] boreopolis]|uniref:ABC transporter permease n=1 Tax=Xanthomonas boreopolis TaxID=86183 RepID=UPI003D9BC21B
MTASIWILSAFGSPFALKTISESLDAKLEVINATSSTAGLPLNYVAPLGKMEGIRNVSYLSIFVFPCPTTSALLTVNAYGGSGLTAMLKSLGANSEDIHTWSNAQNSIIIGNEIAEKCGMRVSNQYELRDLLTGTKIQFKVSSKITGRNGTETGVIAYGRYDYFNKQLPKEGQGKVLKYYIQPTDYRNANNLAKEIELYFSSSAPQVEVITPNDINAGLGRFGQVQALMYFIMAAILISTFISMTTTIVQMIFERQGYMATLLAIGVKKSQLIAAFSAEIITFCLAGMLAGGLLSSFVIDFISSEISWITGTLSTPISIQLSTPVITLVSITVPLAIVITKIMKISATCRHAY